MQITTARAVGFFPVVKADLPADLEPGLKLAVAAIPATQNAQGRAAQPAAGRAWAKGGEFDKVFMDTFQLVVLRGQKPHAVLERRPT